MSTQLYYEYPTICTRYVDGEYREYPSTSRLAVSVTGRWKVTLENGDDTLYVETTHDEPRTRMITEGGWFRASEWEGYVITIVEWRAEDSLILVEEYINDCSGGCDEGEWKVVDCDNQGIVQVEAL